MNSTWWVHLCRNIPEANMEVALFLERGGHPPEDVVLWHVPPVEVADDHPLVGLQLRQLLQGTELADWIHQFLPNKVRKRFHGALT